jgi:AAA+ ATPase superfamily predicted ATPase
LKKSPDLIVNREREIARLRELLDRGEPCLALMYGRRRVGKTHILSRMWGHDASFYFTASETTPTQNRQALLHAFAEWSNTEIHAEDYPTWRSVFRLLLDHDSHGPLVVTLDEFQYMGESPQELGAVASELNAAWEMRRPPRSILFIISGSAVGTLEGLNAGGSPLYGRFAWQTQLRPFPYHSAGQLAGFSNARDQAYAYGIFGGTPRYLAPIDPSRPLSQNVIDLMLRPSGEVRELIQTALVQEQGLRNISKYSAIMRAIGSGRTKLNQIAQATGIDLGPSLREKLERLIQLDYVKSGRNLGARPKEPFRYRLSDPAMRFHFEMVAPLESTLATQSPAHVWERHIEPRLDAYMGFIFEGMAEQAYYLLGEPLELPLVREWGRWEGVDRGKKPLEVDVASLLLDGRVLTGAVKWNRRPVGEGVHTRHMEMIERLANSGVAWAHKARRAEAPLLYVAAGGFTDRFKEVALASRDEVYLWTLEDLYRGVDSA